MSNKGNFSQAMREILGLDSTQNKGKVNEQAGARPEEQEAYETASNTSEEYAASDRLNQDFSQSFSQNSAQNSQNLREQVNNQSDTYSYNQQTQAQKPEEPAFFDKPGYGQAESQNSFEGKFGQDQSNQNASYNNNANYNNAPNSNNANYNNVNYNNNASASGNYNSNGFGGGNSGNGGGGHDNYDDGEIGTTIITRNTIIEGNIKSFENIELNGKVKGRIDTTKNVGVSGYVQGDIEATDILLEGAQIKGNISSKGALLMDKDTLLVGDVEAQNTRVDGKIKGEVNIGGNGEFLSNSVVVGNITVSNFYVQYGARMQGYINTNFSKKEEDSIFGQIVSN